MPFWAKFPPLSFSDHILCCCHFSIKSPSGVSGQSYSVEVEQIESLMKPNKYLLNTRISLFKAPLKPCERALLPPVVLISILPSVLSLALSEAPVLSAKSWNIQFPCGNKPNGELLVFFLNCYPDH